MEGDFWGFSEGRSVAPALVHSMPGGLKSSATRGWVKEAGFPRELRSVMK